MESQLQEEAANRLVAAGRALKHEVVIVHSPEEATSLRKVVDDANNEVGDTGRVVLGIADLRR